MEATINGWMTQNMDSAQAFSINITEVQTEFVKLEILGYIILVTIPPSFYDTSFSDDGGSIFLAVHAEEDGQERDDTLKEVLLTLNEKLERVRIGDNCLNNVLDSVLQVFGPCASKRSPKMQDNSSEVQSSYLYKAAEEARVECEEAFVDESSIVCARILPWCSVSVDPKVRIVELDIQIEGIMASDNVSKALGFCFDSPLKINLGFRAELWLREEQLPPESFGAVEVLVSSGQVGISVPRVPEEWDERMITALNSCYLNRVHQYGPQVLVPDLVKEFFRCHGSNRIDDCLLPAERSNNVFVRLLIFVGTRLSTLGRWCCNCKKELSLLSRWWYCDAELCLFRQEELGVGASVLQELQNSELIDLELSLAAAAAASTNRDVFEPYPAFLLSDLEVRGRSGFFSTHSTRSTISLQSRQVGVKKKLSRVMKHGRRLEWDNKKMAVLRLLINSFPPIAEMQKCENEFELRLMLSTSLQKLVKSDELYDDECLKKEFVKDTWLPYNVLRFVLFTNRLSLILLKDELKLDMLGSHYQFAVLYDSEREKYYENCRATKGSFFAYHGSPANNWYSILRNGLRCLSETPYMSSGMSSGRGIYFSSDINYSYRYCKAGWRIGKLQNYSVIAICEIFLDAVNHGTHLPIVVPPQHEKEVALRYLLVFADFKLWESTIDLKLQEHYKKVRAEYLQKLDNKTLALHNQRLAAFHMRRLTPQH